MSLVQLRHEWSRKLARFNLSLPDQELVRLLAVRKDDVEDFLRYLREVRESIPKKKQSIKTTKASSV